MGGGGGVQANPLNILWIHKCCDLMYLPHGVMALSVPVINISLAAMVVRFLCLLGCNFLTILICLFTPRNK